MKTNYQLTHKQQQELTRIIQQPNEYTAKELVRAQVVLLLAQAVPVTTIMLTTG